MEIGRFDDKSVQVMEYIEYICVSVFTYAYFISCSIEVFRHDIMEHISEIQVISHFG